MIEKFERQLLVHGDLQSVINSVQGTLYQYGIQTTPVGANVWAGKSNQTSYATRPKATFTLTPGANGLLVDLRLGMEIETNGIVILIVCWLFFFPAAIVLALLAYQDVSNRHNQIARAVWAPLSAWLAPTHLPQHSSNTA